MSEPRLADVVRRQSSLLDEIFGEDAYAIVDAGLRACELRTGWVEVALAYDSRDQWVSAQLKPLTVPDDLSDYYPDHSWLMFCGIEVGASRKSAMDDQQVTDALSLIRPIVQLFKDSGLARDALWFVRGYSHAYTEWASGNWD
jgi:hypothetical protein